MEKECVVYTLQMNGLYKTEMNDKLLTAMDKKQKQDILASMYDDIKHNKIHRHMLGIRIRRSVGLCRCHFAASFPIRNHP